MLIEYSKQTPIPILRATLRSRLRRLLLLPVDSLQLRQQQGRRDAVCDAGFWAYIAGVVAGSGCPQNGCDWRTWAVTWGGNTEEGEGEDWAEKWGWIGVDGG